ncbi:PASTA domain-containing protein [Bifidobacterium leontopitheci]|nr:PASTA domain-containing protein [Bifidobacterium leontopitheci]
MPPLPTPPSTPASNATAAAPQRKRAKVVIAAILTVLLVLSAGGLTAYVTYRNELWGGVTVPELPSPKGTAKASGVVERLRQKGIATQTVQEFSGKPSGTYLGLRNAQSGQRIGKGVTVHVRESKGPGVPAGTNGSNVSTVRKRLDDMGVPVHYGKVTVSKDSTVKAGTVISTSPADGEPVKDTNAGIHVGVAQPDDGSAIPVDILGKDVDTVRKALESHGHTVTVVKRFSSRRYVGKVSGSEPALGASLDDGQKVTLYQGVDVTGRSDVLAESGFVPEMNAYEQDPIGLAGKYCTADDEHCLTLQQVAGDHEYTYLRIEDTDDKATAETRWWSMCYAGEFGCPVEHDSTDDFSKDFQYNQPSGVIEMHDIDSETPMCGTTRMFRPGVGSICDHGKYLTDWDTMAGDDDSTGAQWTAGYFFMFFPVGADIDSLEQSGYFSAQALAQTRSGKAVDTDRPFILKRDNDALPSRTASADGDTFRNAFLPGGSEFAMTPAPSDETAYYLVEDGIDWSAVPDETSR